MIRDEKEKEIEIENVSYEKQRAQNDEVFKDQQAALEENLKNQFITKQEYGDRLEELQEEHDTIEKAMTSEHFKNLNGIVEKYELERIKKEIEDTEVTLEQTKKRVKTRSDEAQKNKTITNNIAKLQERLVKLEKEDTEGIEEAEKLKQEEINKTTEAIEKQRSSLDWSKQLANKKNLGEVIGTSGILEGLAGGDKRGFLGKLGLDMTGASDDQVDSTFDYWMEQAGEAVVKWKDITVDALGDCLDAWVDFYEARADAAAEDTEEAKDYYDTQKSLLEQGYANSVNSAWAEYQQKQEIQKKAEEDSKKAQQVQQLADSASEASNLILATSKILSNFAVHPLIANTLIATMWGTFAAAKVMAFKATQYGEGGYEELTGGSHASGHDINLGVRNGKGRSMVAEGGESLAIFSRKARRKYGDQIGDIVNAINAGTYELSSTERLNDNAKGVVKPMRTSVNLGKIENGIGELVSSTKRNTYTDAHGNMVVVKGNSRTTYVSNR